MFEQATEAITYGRFEPVDPPALVLTRKLSEGESLERLVLRSNFDRTTAAYTADTAGTLARSTTTRRLRVHGDRGTPCGPAENLGTDLRAARHVRRRHRQRRCHARERGLRRRGAGVGFADARRAGCADRTGDTRQGRRVCHRAGPRRRDRAARSGRFHPRPFRGGPVPGSSRADRAGAVPARPGVSAASRSMACQASTCSWPESLCNCWHPAWSAW